MLIRPVVCGHLGIFIPRFEKNLNLGILFPGDRISIFVEAGNIKVTENQIFNLNDNVKFA